MSGIAVQVRKYRDQFAGQTAQILQRLTGLLLLAYLFLHVHTIHELSRGPAAFNAAVTAFRHPFFKLLEIALFGTVILHALNGIRITLIDLGIGHGSQRRLFWIYSVGLGAVIFLAGAIPLLIGFFGAAVEKN
jgi:succinate dehydrogenase / fumarate reductase cytochrome b subunit